MTTTVTPNGQLSCRVRTVDACNVVRIYEFSLRVGDADSLPTQGSDLLSGKMVAPREVAGYSDHAGDAAARYFERRGFDVHGFDGDVQEVYA